MAIPIATTLFSVLSQSQAATRDELDGWAPYDTVDAKDVRAVLTILRRGQEQQTGATEERVTADFNCDVAPIDHTKRILDQTTGLIWDVKWARDRNDVIGGAGLDHTTGQLIQVTGVST